MGELAEAIPEAEIAFATSPMTNKDDATKLEIGSTPVARSVMGELPEAIPEAEIAFATSPRTNKDDATKLEIGFRALSLSLFRARNSKYVRTEKACKS